MNNDDIPQFTSVEGVAQKLGVSKQTIYRYMERKENPLPFVKFSDQTIRIPLDQLEIWIIEQKGGELK